MAIRKYTKRDYPMIASWCRERGKPVPAPEILSDTGFIADNRVVGWLYITNSNVAMIENVISNPTTVPSLRRQSLRTLCAHLVDSALILGYVNIFGITNHPSIKKICKDMGFKEAQFSVFTLAEPEMGPEDM